MTSGSAEAREASTSTTSFRHRSSSIPASSLPSGSSPPSHRQSKRSLSNAAAAVVHHHAVNGSACGADGTSGGGPSTDAALSMSGASTSSPSPSSSSLALQSKTGIDGLQRSPPLSCITEGERQASGSGSSHKFATAAHSPSRRASGSCHPCSSSSSSSRSYEAGDGRPQHHGRARLPMPPRPQLDEDHESMANYHTSSPLSEQRLALPDLADYHSVVSHSRSAKPLTDSEQAGRPLCGQHRPETVPAESYGESSQLCLIYRSRAHPHLAFSRPLDSSRANNSC